MRILEVNTEKTWRGGERQTWYNCKGFRDAGEEVELLCRENCPLSEKISSLEIPVHRIHSAWQTFLFLAKKGSSFDIIHVQTARNQFHALLARPFHKRPVVYTRRVDFVPSGFFTKRKYRRTDKIIAISTVIKNILEKIGVKNVGLITEIAEEKKLNAERAKKFIAENNFSGKKIIATTSAIVQHKDPLNMAATIAELSKKRTDFVFLHFGDGVLKNVLENKISELKISDRYKLMGFVENVEDFFSVFDVFAMSSEEEGLGSSVLDAFLYNVPVASTEAGGLKEIIGDAGLVCKIKDPVALAENIDRLLNDEKLRNELTMKANKKVKENNSIEAVTKKYLVEFRKLIDPGC
ncbi:MAG: glycosyltransferase family 4 protein [Bacteroidetes bacterium]|nr:glycosyltransferase family 4 protein [Bacteroidota bacterium]